MERSPIITRCWLAVVGASLALIIVPAVTLFGVVKVRPESTDETPRGVQILTVGAATQPAPLAPITANSAPYVIPSTQPASTEPSLPVAAAPTTKPSAAPAMATVTIDPEISNAVRAAVANQTYECSEVYGGAFARRPFSEVSPDGVLVGLRIGLGKFFSGDMIKCIQPIYLTPQGEKAGRAYGDRGAVTTIVLARAPRDYAIGAVEVRGGGGLDAVTVTYMRFNGTRLDPTDAMVTPRIGGTGGGSRIINGDGTPIIGICGNISDKKEWMGLGLIFVKPTATVTRR